MTTRGGGPSRDSGVPRGGASGTMPRSSDRAASSRSRCFSTMTSASAVKYVRRIEELIEAPVTLLSTSPEREDTILMKDPFAG